MEFKGTKGKWEVGVVNNGEHGINGIVVWSPEYSKKSDGTYEMVCHISTPEEEIKTDSPNALLISKAPEMLEMLKEILDTNRDYWGEDENSVYQIYEIENLIKEATEI